MNCVRIADIAAFVSQHGPAILYQRDSIPPQAMMAYWASSRSRLELWNQALSRYRREERSGDVTALQDWWREHIGMVEEILVSDLLTRVIATLAAGLDEAQQAEEISPITESIYLSHLEVRNRVQKLMLYGRGSSPDDTIRLNRLRKCIERYTDILLGRMSVSSPGSIRYAFDSKRAGVYAEEMRSHGFGMARDTVSWLMNTALHDMLVRRTSETPSLPQANRAVTESVMLMLRPDLFDSVGSLKSLWLHRLEVGTKNADRVLKELKAVDITQAPTSTGMENLHSAAFERWYL